MNIFQNSWMRSWNREWSREKICWERNGWELFRVDSMAKILHFWKAKKSKQKIKINSDHLQPCCKTTHREESQSRYRVNKRIDYFKRTTLTVTAISTATAETRGNFFNVVWENVKLESLCQVNYFRRVIVK